MDKIEVISKYCHHLSLNISNYIALCNELYYANVGGYLNNQFQSFSFLKKLDNGLFRYKCNKHRITFDSQYYLIDSRIHIYNHNYFSIPRTVYMVTYKEIIGNVKLFNEVGPRTYYINRRGSVGFVKSKDVMVKNNSQLTINLELLDDL